MNCNIGLLSEFEEKHPDAIIRQHKISVRQAGLVTGVACLKRNEMWVFVDRVVFLEQRYEYIIPILTQVTIHEIIHLCGVKNEQEVKYGEMAVI
jgi:predicted SprT family Zn-dependent metalloprotease